MKFIKCKIGEKRTVSMSNSKVSICTLPESLSLKVVWVCCTVLQLFSLASYFLHTECGLCQCIMGIDLLGFANSVLHGAEFVEVLPQNTDKETDTKMS